MPYIIDGHNLIPHIPDLTLSDLDDEERLIHVLQHFANQRRAKVEVFFDRAPAANARKETHGLVLAHFVSQGTTADNAIKARLANLGPRAKNWTVVSSDREILSEVRSWQAKIIQSAEFAQLLTDDQKTHSGPDKNPDPEITPGDVDFWLDQFSDN